MSDLPSDSLLGSSNKCAFLLAVMTLRNKEVLPLNAFHSVLFSLAFHNNTILSMFQNIIFQDKLSIWFLWLDLNPTLHSGTQNSVYMAPSSHFYQGTFLISGLKCCTSCWGVVVNEVILMLLLKTCSGKVEQWTLRIYAKNIYFWQGHPRQECHLNFPVKVSRHLYQAEII